MPKRTDLEHVLVIGSGPILIGQAAEFDYSGTQACRVLQGRGPAGQPGQQQPGDDHDRPRGRRRHLRRAADAGVRREGHRQGAPRRAAGHPRRADRAQHRDRPLRERRAGEVRRPAHRRRRRRDQPRRGPADVQGHRPVDRRRRPALDGLRAPSRRRSPPPRRSATRSSSGRSFTMGGLGSGIATDEPMLRRMAAPRARRLPGAHRPHRGVGAGLEGVRARADARPQRQRGRHLLDREHRRDGRAHRRLGDRRPGDDAHRPRVPADARRRHRGAARGRRRHRRLQHPVRRPPGDRPAGRHRDEPAGLPVAAPWRRRPPASRSPRSPRSSPSATPSTRSPTTSPASPRRRSSRRWTTSS